MATSPDGNVSLNPAEADNVVDFTQFTGVKEPVVNPDEDQTRKTPMGWGAKLAVGAAVAAVAVGGLKVGERAVDNQLNVQRQEQLANDRAAIAAGYKPLSQLITEAPVADVDTAVTTVAAEEVPQDLAAESVTAQPTPLPEAPPYAEAKHDQITVQPGDTAYDLLQQNSSDAYTKATDEARRDMEQAVTSQFPDGVHELPVGAEASVPNLDGPKPQG